MSERNSKMTQFKVINLLLAVIIGVFVFVNMAQPQVKGEVKESENTPSPRTQHHDPGAPPLANHKKPQQERDMPSDNDEYAGVLKSTSHLVHGDPTDKDMNLDGGWLQLDVDTNMGVAPKWQLSVHGHIKAGETAAHLEPQFAQVQAAFYSQPLLASEVQATFSKGGREISLNITTDNTEGEVFVQPTRVSCSNNTRCSLKAGCFASMEGVCYDAPREVFDAPLKRPLTKGELPRGRRVPYGGTPHNGEELVCSWMTMDSSELPSVPEKFRSLLKVVEVEEEAESTSSGAQDVTKQQQQPPRTTRVATDFTPTELIQAFKLITGSFFERWYEFDTPVKWVADLVEPGAEGEEEKATFTTTGYHREPAMLSAATIITEARGKSEIISSDGNATREDGIAEKIKELEADLDVHRDADIQAATSIKRRESDQLFIYENICVRPSGRLAGFQPIIRRYEGGSDVTSEVRHANRVQEEYMYQWLLDVEELEEEPEWYVDRPLVIVPMLGEWSVHPGHAMQRAGNVVWNVDAAFPRAGWDAEHPDWARKDVTTMYTHIWTPEHITNPLVRGFKPRPFCHDNCTWEDYGFKHYTTLATQSHFMTYSQEGAAFRMFESKTSPGRALLDQAHGAKIASRLEQVLTEKPICFKEAMVWQACPFNQCFKPHEGNAWPLYGWRNPLTQKKVAKRFRACAAVEHLERSQIDPQNLTLLYSYRHKASKRIEYDQVLAAQIWHWVVNVAKGRFFVAALNDVPLDLVALYSQVDIVLAPYGSGLLYGFVSPPGSMAIELSFKGIAPRGYVGIDRNPRQDYGSLWKALSGHHLSLGMTGEAARMGSAISVPMQLIDVAVKSALCAVNTHTVVPAYLTADYSAQILDEERLFREGSSSSSSYTANTSTQRRSKVEGGKDLMRVPSATTKPPLTSKMNVTSVSAALLAQVDLRMWREWRTTESEVIYSTAVPADIPLVVPNEIAQDEDPVKRCQVNRELVNSLTTDMRDDLKGDYLRLAVRTFVQDYALANSHWLLMMHQHASHVAPALARLRFISQYANYILMLYDCPRSREHLLLLQAKVEAELHFMRRYITQSSWVLVMTKKRCPAHLNLNGDALEKIGGVSFDPATHVRGPERRDHNALAVSGGIRWCGSILSKKPQGCVGVGILIDTIMADASAVDDSTWPRLKRYVPRRRKAFLLTFGSGPRPRQLTGTPEEKTVTPAANAIFWTMNISRFAKPKPA